jgi:hypothetical protein
LNGLKHLERVIIGITKAGAVAYDTAPIEASSMAEKAGALVAHVKV